MVRAYHHGRPVIPSNGHTLSFFPSSLHWVFLSHLLKWRPRPWRYVLFLTHTLSLVLVPHNSSLKDREQEREKKKASCGQCY
ncbi:hypothetical protein BDV23DRAFT_154834 [Aspergillus alliaceus]|uniref:Uncharacterized protein n=1 Tax=Petromyces alliaceus TaxID=209559 RepID=A0A5N7C8V1_PETAA|nr:hypothetical protein BDV23DRAFT_154834 [Aspergillus alliaceus]